MGARDHFCQVNYEMNPQIGDGHAPISIAIKRSPFEAKWSLHDRKNETNVNQGYLAIIEKKQCNVSCGTFRH